MNIVKKMSKCAIIQGRSRSFGAHGVQGYKERKDRNEKVATNWLSHGQSGRWWSHEMSTES